ncbi:MAG: addiction module protein [Pontiellaceae bacterium]|nr:addiction module protein [Pontiellaceae bacterium]
MTALAERIYNEVLELPSDEQRCLMDKLLHIIPPPITSEVEKLWLEESHRRLDDIRAGRSKTVSGADVFKEVKERYGA